MKIFIWNCRGAGNKLFRRTFKELMKNHNPSIVILMETKVVLSSMGLFFNNLGYTASTHVDPVGRSGGIWILWDPFQVIVQALEANHQVIHAKVKKGNYPDWILSAVYASPNPRRRDELWENLESVADNIQEPWLVAGDFNDIASHQEKRSFSPNLSQERSRKFAARMNRCNLMDLGCSGPRLTWSNGRQGLANTMERLDRAACTSEWRALFTEGAVRNLPRTYSDHSPMIVYTQGRLKLNTDGCARGDPGVGGFGGLWRDERGLWICGFYGKLEECTSLEAELWGVYRGLTIAFEKGFKDFDIELDSTMVIELLQEDSTTISLLRSLIADSKYLIRRCNCKLQHVLREGNASADRLANMGADQSDHLVVLDDPPETVRRLVVADMVGQGRLRS